MPLINRTGVFRGRAVEAGVSVSSSGLPQYIIKCEAFEYFDQASGEWVDWLDVEENTITAYLCLFSKENAPLFHAKDIQAVFGWDGLSLSALDSLDVSKIEFQFIVEEHLYNDKTSLQVSKIAPYDAVPGSTLRRCDAAQLKSLDAKFAAALLKSSGGKKAVQAPAKPTGIPAAPKKSPGRPKKPAVSTPEVAAPPADVPAVAAPVAATPPTRVKTPPPPPVQPAVTEYADAEAAWGAVNNVRAKEVTDEKLAECWGEACAKIAGDAEDADITPAQWGLIVEAVNNECAIF